MSAIPDKAKVVTTSIATENITNAGIVINSPIIRSVPLDSTNPARMYNGYELILMRRYLLNANSVTNDIGARYATPIKQLATRPAATIANSGPKILKAEFVFAATCNVPINGYRITFIIGFTIVLSDIALATGGLNE